MSNYLAYGNKVISGGGGNSSSSGGHIIEDASGTELTQQPVLKFKGGLKATDNSTDSITEIDDSPTEIEWDDWIEMTPEQQAAIPKALVLNAPGIDGDISVDLMTKLWENPSPSAAFAGQNITLSSSDYNMLLWIVRSTASTGTGQSLIINKGEDAWLNVCQAASNGSRSWRRRALRTDDTHYTIEDAYEATGTTAVAVANPALIPIAIYGIKKTVTANVSVIAADVSTSADKCMLSDGITSVEDIIDKGSVSVNADGTKTYAQLWNELFALIDKTKVTRNSQLIWYTGYYNIVFNIRSYQSTEIILYYSITLSTGLLVDTVSLSDSSSSWTRGSATPSGTTITSKGSEVPANTYVFTFYY